VGREQHGRPVGPERPDQRAHRGDALGVEAVGRFVQDQQPRAAQQRGRDAEPLTHAERVAGEAVVAAMLQLDDFEHPVDLGVGQSFGSGQDLQIGAAGQVRHERGGLDQGADLAQHLRRTGRVAEHAHRTCVRANQAEQDAQERGLAGAVRAEQSVDLSRKHFQAHAAQGVDLAEALPDAADCDGGGGRDDAFRPGRGGLGGHGNLPFGSVS
jgi:hypothetical protein